MGEAAGDEELAAVLGGKRNSDMPAEGRRAFADINGDIPYRAADHANKLRLGMGRGLPVEAADYALGGKALVVLDEGVGYAGIAVAFGVVGFAEPAALVAEHVGFDDFYARDFCFD